MPANSINCGVETGVQDHHDQLTSFYPCFEIESPIQDQALKCRLSLSISDPCKPSILNRPDSQTKHINMDKCRRLQTPEYTGTEVSYSSTSPNDTQNPCLAYQVSVHLRIGHNANASFIFTTNVLCNLLSGRQLLILDSRNNIAYKHCT